MDCVYPGRPIIEGGQTSTGSVIAWFKRHFAEHIDFDTLNTEAGAIAAGGRRAAGLRSFPGQPHALHRCAVARRDHRADAEAHARPCLSRAGGRRLLRHAADRRDLRRCVSTRGGSWWRAGPPARPSGCRSMPTRWACRWRSPRSPRPARSGSAILAATGAGQFATIDEGCAAMVRVARTIEPDMARHAAYAPIYARYLAAYARAETAAGGRMNSHANTAALLRYRHDAPHPVLRGAGGRVVPARRKCRVDAAPVDRRGGGGRA